MSEGRDDVVRARLQRVLGVVLLLALGLLSLPVAAWFLDGPGTENWIVPVQVGFLAVAGAAVGIVLPGLTGAASRARRGVRGALLALLMGLLGVLVLFLLLSGPGGA